jgi:hypothetical protein
MSSLSRLSQAVLNNRAVVGIDTPVFDYVDRFFKRISILGYFDPSKLKSVVLQA